MNKCIYKLKITLMGSKPPIWRRVLVSSNITFEALHDIIQPAFGWSDCHLHEFEIDNLRIGTNDEDSIEPVEEESEFVLDEYAQRGDTFLYTYDFGDNWEHRILVEDMLPADSTNSVPRCIAGRRACPPENVGGVWGYQEFLSSISDPSHEEHANYTEWIGGNFDPEEFDLNAVNTLIANWIPSRQLYNH